MADQPRLTIIPCTRKQANDFVSLLHRHHKPVVSGKFALAVVDEQGQVRGVAMVGNPIARPLNDGVTVEVNRVATDGCPNACSALYGAAWRIARAMGYRRMLTYILEHEPGTSLRASGWLLDGEVEGRSWSSKSRPRAIESHPTCGKQRWVVEVQKEAVFQGSPRWPAELVDERNPILEMFGIGDEDDPTTA
jgi:hypothetical protein